MPEQAETWASALERLSLLLGGRSEQFRAEAEEWLRQTVRAAWKAESLHDLSRAERGLAFRRLLGAIDDLADEGEIALAPDLRALVAATLERWFSLPEFSLPGPDWRIAPAELDRPTYAEATDDALPI